MPCFWAFTMILSCVLSSVPYKYHEYGYKYMNMVTCTTQIPEMLGHFFNLNKMKTKDFQITWANILFTVEHREHNKCLNGEIYPLNELISNLMPATGLKKVGTGATKGWKSKTFWKDSAGRISSNYLS